MLALRRARRVPRTSSVHARRDATPKAHAHCRQGRPCKKKPFLARKSRRHARCGPGRRSMRTFSLSALPSASTNFAYSTCHAPFGQRPTHVAVAHASEKPSSEDSTSTRSPLDIEPCTLRSFSRRDIERKINQPLLQRQAAEVGGLQIFSGQDLRRQQCDGQRVGSAFVALKGKSSQTQTSFRRPKAYSLKIIYNWMH